MSKYGNKKIDYLKRINERREKLLFISNGRTAINSNNNMNERDLRRIYGEKSNNVVLINKTNIKCDELYTYKRCEHCNKVGILIVNLNNIELTKKCINSLKKQTNKNFKIFLVDQNSDEIDTDVFLNECHMYNDIIVYKNHTNIPLNHVWNNFKYICDYEYLCYLNNDVIVSSNFIDDTINVLDNNKEIGVVIHVTNNTNYCQSSNVLNYTIPAPARYQGWDFTIKRELYPTIPEELLIFGGDDYIFAKLNTNNVKIGLIYSSPIIHFKEKTRCNIPNIRDIQIKDANNFWNIAKNENLVVAISTMDDNICFKYPPPNFQLKQNKKCVYTACIGDYDYLSPINNKLDDWDYFCFTDNLNLKSNEWKIIYVENNDNILYNNTKKARYFKTNYHKYLSSYEIILWIDCRIIISCDINEYMQHLDMDTDIVFVKHYDANSINEEFERVLSCKLETVEMINNIKKRYSIFNYKYDNGLMSSGILLYKNNEKICKFFNDWWYEIANYSLRDQLSCSFVLWRNKDVKYKYLSNILGDKFKQNKRRKKRLNYE